MMMMMMIKTTTTVMFITNSIVTSDCGSVWQDLSGVSRTGVDSAEHVHGVDADVVDTG